MEEDSSLQELKGIPHGGCSPALVALAHPPLWDLLVLSSQGQYRALQAWLVLAFFFFRWTLPASGRGCPVSWSSWTAKLAWILPLGSSLPHLG